MPHTPSLPDHATTAPRPLSADAVWQAVDGTARRAAMQRQAEALRQGAFPAALAMPLQQCLAAMPLPPALRAYASPPAADPVPSATPLHTWIERLLREPGVMDALQRVLPPAQQGSLGTPDTSAPGPAPSPPRVVPSAASLVVGKARPPRSLHRPCPNRSSTISTS